MTILQGRWRLHSCKSLSRSIKRPNPVRKVRLQSAEDLGFCCTISGKNQTASCTHNINSCVKCIADCTFASLVRCDMMSINEISTRVVATLRKRVVVRGWKCSNLLEVRQQPKFVSPPPYYLLVVLRLLTPRDPP